MSTDLAHTFLRMEHISKSFSGIEVLKDVDFDLEPGEVHVLAGENGAGKTTLIKILAGVHTDYTGTIHLDGQMVRFKSPMDAALHGISAIHQEMSLIGPMPVVDNIFLGREKTRGFLWMHNRAQKEKARALLGALGLDIDVQLPAEEYPLSVRQMVEIAKALAHRARIIIMDEPTSALNDMEVARLFQIVRDLKSQGYGIIYITHRLEEIYEIGDRITVLRDGHKIGTSSCKELPPRELIRWMVGREITQQFPSRIPSPKKPVLDVRHFHLPDPQGSRKWAVADVSLILKEGEIVGVAGLRGSGKSELLNGLFGTFGKRTLGEVCLDGRKFRPFSPARSIEQGLVLLTNDRKRTGLIPCMDVVRNISLSSLSRHSPFGWMLFSKETQAAQEQIRSLGIRIFSFAQEVETLSGGNQQKVVLAKWLETRPKVLLLDEPTLGVDVGAKHDIYALMNRWTSRGMAILMTTSELPELLAMSDRILVMHRGRLTAEFPSSEATQERVLRAAMGGESPG
ncbi:MAG: sugar ABC transporter ATP-binding protein [Candidatus Aminicenantales bacterium]